MIDAARARFDPVRVIAVTAPPETLAERQGPRGHESAGDIARRLARAGWLALPGPDVIEIDNSGDLDAAIEAFVAALPQPASV